MLPTLSKQPVQVLKHWWQADQEAFRRGSAWALGGLLLIGAGYCIALFQVDQLQTQTAYDPVAEVIDQQLQYQREEIAAVRLRVEESIDALAVQLGQLKAHALRLDALGERLTTMANLKAGEFDFKNPPALGGAQAAREAEEPFSADTLMSELSQLQRQLIDREKQLRILEDLVLTGNMRKQSRPAGNPVTAGWISSPYGARYDPITGRRTMHSGVDFAAPYGTEIYAVAPGVVRYAGYKSNFGNVVEVDHGNGYVTRYAHNQHNEVKMGDTVERGQLIARVGSTGRSTGPHVHFSVVHNGNVVSPHAYLDKKQVMRRP